jgi:hypothetical protein
MECRYSERRIVVELLVVLLTIIPLTLAVEHHQIERFLRIGVALGPSALAIVVLVIFRWRSRVLISPQGLELRRSEGVALKRLGWDEVEELFILGPEEFELRGGGISIRLTAAYEGVSQARSVVSARLGSLRERLHDRALREGELVFRMPLGRWKAHVFYITVLIVLTILTGMLVAPMVSHAGFGFPAVGILMGGAWVWSLRRQASGMGTVVTLYRDGLLVRRLDGSRKVAWSEVAGTEWNGEGGLVLRLTNGKRVFLPPQLANVTLLEGFVEEARTGTRSA